MNYMKNLAAAAMLCLCLTAGPSLKAQDAPPPAGADLRAAKHYNTSINVFLPGISYGGVIAGQPLTVQATLNASAAARDYIKSQSINLQLLVDGQPVEVAKEKTNRFGIAKFTVTVPSLPVKSHVYMYLTYTGNTHLNPSKRQGVLTIKQ